MSHARRHRQEPNHRTDVSTDLRRRSGLGRGDASDKRPGESSLSNCLDNHTVSHYFDSMKVSPSIVLMRKRITNLALMLVLIAGGAAWAQDEKKTSDKSNQAAEKAPGSPAAVQPTVPSPAPAAPAGPTVAQPILKLDEVRVGMKGYGMTVFHGAKIEPFSVEVISVMRDFAPQRGVVWIRCDDERLQKTGPVSGMSGSPIYLWDDKDEKKEIGKGGKLIGAFAFGFGWTKDCYAGVQPIESMRQTGDRITGDKPGADAGKPDKAPRRAALHGATVADLLRAGHEWKLDDSVTWKAQAFAKVVGLNTDDPKQAAKNEAPAAQGFTLPRGPDALAIDASPARLMLPMTVASESLARTLTPLLAPMGIQPMQAAVPGGRAGLPPPNVDPKSVKLEPGSVLAIPLAFGDADLSATGTVTDVLPDGRVLAFGHPMFSQGDIAVPMATGYVHFIVPRLPGSFKLGGGIDIKGTILRDDAAAVAGKPGKQFFTAPATIHVSFNGKKKTYKYQVVHHDRLTPSLVLAVAMQSLTADQGLPLENTVRIRGEAIFDGDRRISLASISAPANEQRLLFDLVPAVGTMLQNPHESMRLTAIELHMEVTDRIDQLAILGARVDKPKVEPGEVVNIAITVQGYGKARESRKLAIKVPDSLADGRYLLTVGDARSLGRLIMMTRPHLLTANSADDVYEAVKLLTSFRQDVIYGLLQLPPTGIALGRVELPRLPSSRRTLIAGAQDTLASPLADWVKVELPVDAAVNGEVTMEIDVEKTRK